jgi:ubiquinone biosynthesis protein COQ4
MRQPNTTPQAAKSDKAAGSRLASSSRFLNAAGLRRWCAVETLRKNGADLPAPAGAFQVVELLAALRDRPKMERLISEEREKFPAFDDWYRHGKAPDFTVADLERCPPGSVGAILLKYVVDNNFQLDLMPRPEPATQWDRLIRIRSRSHDVEHIMLGAGFDYMGEVPPYYFNMAQAARFFSAELAGELNQMYVFGSLRYTVRTVLHYPRAWPTVLESFERGTRAGMASDCLLFTDYGPFLPLSVAEARLAAGFREVADVDTREMARVWGAESHKALLAASGVAGAAQ